MTHPLLGSPGNTAAQLQPLEHASGNKNGKAGGNADAPANGNDFKKMVRELSSDAQPKTNAQPKAEAQANPKARSGEAAVDAQQKAPAGESTVNATKIAVQRNPDASDGELEELIEGDPELEKQGLAAQEDPEQSAENTADGDEQNGLLQTRQNATPVATDEDDELSPDDTEDLPEEYDLDATAEISEDEEREDGLADSLSDTKLAQGDAKENDIALQDKATVKEERPQRDVASHSQQPLAPQQDDAEVEARPAERQSGNQPAQTPTRPEDALRASLQRLNAANTPTETDGQKATAVDPKATVQPGEVNNIAATGSSPVDPASQSEAATKPTVVQHSQLSLTDGQLQAIQNATGAAKSLAQAGESPQSQTIPQTPEVAGVDRLPPVSDARLGVANGDLQTLLREQRTGESLTATGLPKLGPVTTGAHPDAALAGAVDDLSEGKPLSLMQDGDLLRRVAALTGAQIDRPSFETALSVSRQLSQGVVGALSVWVGAASSQSLGGSSTGSSGDFMGGRSPASDLNMRPVGQPPGELRTIRLQLQPASLGTVTAQLTMKNDELHVKFVVERAETSELIQSQRNLLLAQLVEAGVEVNAANVEVETSRTSGARSAAVHTGLAGGANEFAGGAFGSADGRSRSASGERDGLTEQVPVDDDASGNEATGQAAQRPSVVYL